MSGRISWIAFVLAIGLVLAFIFVTRRDFSRRNVRIFSGMVYSAAYQPQESNAVFANGQTNQAPPVGTIPRGFHPYPYPNTPDGRDNSGWELKNPFPRSPEVLARGKQVYQNFCSHCHGPQGLGDGPVAQRSLLSMTLHGKVTKDRDDGEIFHIITYGRLFMPQHGSIISQEDRWKVIHYVRQLQQPNG